MPTLLPFHILLIDDDEVDVELVRRVFRKRGVAVPLSVATDGTTALQFLRDTRLIFDRRLVVLLDLNLPGIDGIEFLSALRKEPRGEAVMVFVLSTSDLEADKKRALQHCILGYFVKASGEQYIHEIANFFVERMPGQQPVGKGTQAYLRVRPADALG